MNKVYFGDNLHFLKLIEDKSVDLIYTDILFNTKKKQTRKTFHSVRNDSGNVGFGEHKYIQNLLKESFYEDDNDNFLSDLYLRLVECYRILKDNGSLYLHVDYREVHYIRILLDDIFGEDNFRNEIIWHWDYGAKSKNKWSNKHNNILFYSKTDDYKFNVNECDRLEYIAPNLVGEEKSKRGKLPTTVWEFNDVIWQTIVPTNGKEKTGYPTQKPEKLLERIIKVASDEDDLVLDFCAGSGTTGFVANKLNRNFIMIDNNLSAIEVIQKRFENIDYKLENITI